jgi:hypothetical protein
MSDLASSIPGGTWNGNWWTPPTAGSGTALPDLTTGEIELANQYLPSPGGQQPTNLAEQFDAAQLENLQGWAQEAGLEQGGELVEVLVDLGVTVGVVGGALVLGGIAIYSGLQLAHYLADANPQYRCLHGFHDGDPTGWWRDNDGMWFNTQGDNPLQGFRWPQRPAGKAPAPMPPPGSQKPTPAPPGGNPQDPNKGAFILNSRS